MGTADETPGHLLNRASRGSIGVVWIAKFPGSTTSTKRVSNRRHVQRLIDAVAMQVGITAGSFDDVHLPFARLTDL